MTETTTNDLTHITLAVLLGLLGNALLRDAQWGLNLTLWLITLIGIAFYLRHHAAYPKLGRTIWIAGAFSLLFTWRDSPVLQWLALTSVGAAVAFASLGRLSPAPTLLRYIGVCVDTVCTVYPVVFRRFPSATVSVYRRDILRAPIVERILRGLLLSIVPAIVFGWLLIAADANFQLLMVNFFLFDPVELADTTVAVFIWALAACVALYVLTTGPLAHVEHPPFTAPKAYGSVEINVVLTVINLLFAAFVSTQFEYLFGGHARIAADGALTYSAYGRRGFFELATVAVLSFGMLGIFNVFMPREERAARLVFAALGLLHIALIGVVIASGFHRMGVYIQTYGFTELRFYVCAGMAWIALQFLGLAFVIVFARAAFLPWFLTRSALAAVLVLHAINPDAWIAQANLDRRLPDGKFDASYAAKLSADAVPTLVEGLADLQPTDQTRLRQVLERRPERAPSTSVIEFNVSRHLAHRALQYLDGIDAINPRRNPS